MEYLGVIPGSFTPACRTPAQNRLFLQREEWIWGGLGYSCRHLVGSSLFWLVLSAVGLALETGSEGPRYLISGGATYFQSRVPLKATNGSSWRKLAILVDKDPVWSGSSCLVPDISKICCY